MNNSLSVHPEPYLKLPRNFGPHPSFKNKESKVAKLLYDGYNGRKFSK